ncbi:hypothetical protein ACLOJK_018974 [Asimina triloba]
MAHRFADEGWSIGRFAIWPRCWPGGKKPDDGSRLGELQLPAITVRFGAACWPSGWL